MIVKASQRIFLLLPDPDLSLPDSIGVRDSSWIGNFNRNCSKQSYLIHNIKREFISKQTVFPLNSCIRFDTTNLTEYLFVVSGQYVAALCEFIHFANLTAFGIGAFILFLAAMDDLKENLKSINEHADSTEHRLDIFKQLAAFTHRYSIVQELSLNLTFICRS